MQNYRKAALRHFDDGDYLLDDHRLPNADHHYGVAAECALKAIMRGLGMPMKLPSGQMPKYPHNVHVNELWSLFHIFANGNSGSVYSSLVPSANPFVNWSVHDRYEDGSKYTSAMLADHKVGASETLACMNQAFVDGVVR
ncbi:MAG TPA: hypothetical protein PKO15_16095 [Fibrobacteria bacterium]|nr:hypothetical protein [Fibrobacteria bacterium]HOX51721.1 hypothetical protein [Fibrobacteria bacterium]